MKFIFNGENMALASATEGLSLMEKYNRFADKVIGKETELIFQPTAVWLGDQLTALGQWIVANLPDIMGYGTILAGVLMIIGAMMSKGGMIKIIGGWAALMILALCILGGV